MAYGIERRLKEDLFAFIVANQEYYEELSRYVPVVTSYPELIQTYLKDGWRLVKEGIWYNVIYEEAQVPAQGFKIHISATSKTALETLARVGPLCLETQAPFKFLADPFLLNFANSKSYSRSSSGKFITVYPNTEEACGKLLEALYSVTRDLSGPYILSDKPYKESKAIFYRYGGFRPKFQLNLFGERVPLIQASNGSLIPDLRSACFQLPPGVQDPFAGPVVNHTGPILLGQRYAIGTPLRFSNSGGIYIAEDQHSSERVVIKEARPFVGLTESNPADAVATLQKEARVLKALQHTNLVPRFIDYFQEWEHHFLVEEYVDGVQLSSYRAFDDIGLLVQRKLTAERVAAFCQRFDRLARNLFSAVQAFHDQGIIIGDLSPSNILVDPESLHVKLIDFEGAFIEGESVSLLDAMVTTGFVSSRRLDAEPPTFADDFYSLGAVLYSIILPIQEFFVINPDARGPFLEEILRDFDLPREVGIIISSFLNGDINRARLAIEALALSRRSEWRPRLEAKAKATEAELQNVLQGIGDYILATKDPTRDDRLFPSDYRVFTTNPLNISYGALGVALFLRDLLGSVPGEVEDWISRQALDLERYPPGLYAGLGGIAWGLSEIGLSEHASEAFELAYSSPLAYEGPDLFFGAAGLGLVSLYWWGKTQQPNFLVKARESAEALLRLAKSDDSGYYWINSDGGHYYGYAHGGSGIAFFLLKLYLATQESRYLEYGKQALKYEMDRAIEKDGCAVWHRSASNPLLSPYWRYGAAGIGSVLIRYYAALGEEQYLALAEKAARYVATKYAVFPGQFIGLSGMGEFLLDMYIFTGNSNYLEDAWRTADGILLFRTARQQGIAFPGEELIRLSMDFGTGSAGIGHFFLRVLRPGPRTYYDFDLPGATIAME